MEERAVYGLTVELAGDGQTVSEPRAAALIRAVDGVEVAVPAEALQACEGCWTEPMDVLDDVAVDPAEGCATVTLRCAGCGAGDDYTWELADHEFAALFGQPLRAHASVLLEEHARAGGSPGPVASRPAHAGDADAAS